MELRKARLIAEEMALLLQPACERVAVAGSVRRQKPHPNDVELLCIPRHYCGVDMLDMKVRELVTEGVLDFRLNRLGRRVYGPRNKLMLHVPSGIGVDIFSTDETCWAVSMVVRTGGENTNKRIAGAALQKGWRFRAYGDGFDTPDGHIVCSTEQEVFEAAGLPYLPPTLRD